MFKIPTNKIDEVFTKLISLESSKLKVHLLPLRRHKLHYFIHVGLLGHKEDSERFKLVAWEAKAVRLHQGTVGIVAVTVEYLFTGF